MNIIENRKKFFLLSLLIILVGFGFMYTNAKAGRGMLNWDVEFTGGTSMQIDMGEAYDGERLAEIITEVTDQSAPQIQQVMGTNEAEIKLQSIDGATRTALMRAIWFLPRWLSPPGRFLRSRQKARAALPSTWLMPFWKV